MPEHPKTAILRYIAQNTGNPTAIKLSIDNIEYEHTHQKINNKDIFVCTVTYSMNQKKNIIIILDFENINKLSDVDKLMLHIASISKNRSDILIKIIKIAGFCSTVKNSADIVVRSNRKDAVDHYISYFVGKMEANKN